MTEYNNQAEINWVVESLEDWYEKNKRALPWRDRPSAYHVWVSEIMLQQTRVEAVKGYYDRFLCALPTIEDLANASEETILKLWEGLGYYNRVRNMQIAAKTIMERYDGEFPDTYEEIISLKGIGEYTAGAIASIAFNEAVPAVDGNVLRVISRLTGSFDDIMLASTKKNMTLWLQHVVPFSHPGKFNQALMDLGAMICIPNGEPRCQECPFAEKCVAFQEHLTDQLPVRVKKTRKRKEEKTVLLLHDGQRVGITKREEKGLLSGMWQFPMISGAVSLHDVEQKIQKACENNAKCDAFVVTAAHRDTFQFSHIEWQMVGRKVAFDRLPDSMTIDGQEIRFVTMDEIEHMYSIPSAFAKYKKIAANLLQ